VTRIYTAGAKAVAVISDGGTELVLEDSGTQCVVVDPKDPETVFVGTSDEGIFKSENGGESWERLSGVAHPRITSLAVSPVDGAVYAGTEPSSLFVSRDGGESWRELEALKNLPSAPTWSFPPRPWTSHVRAIALSHADPKLIVAGIELGGVVRSPDGGESWEDQRPGAYADCHALATHPAVPRTLYEAAGGGFAESDDFGDSWSPADSGIRHRYVWGLAVDSGAPEAVYVSAAHGARQAHGGGFADAAIYRHIAGRWEPLLERLAEFPRALAADPEDSGSLYAAFSDGKISRYTDQSRDWREIARVPSVDALAVVPG
jgi:photosystem II stability/assembly factor-like uncharacterized protein